MKWIAAAVLAGCLVIALAIVSSQPDPPAPHTPTSLADIDLPEPQTEALCMADNGVWVVSDFGIGSCQGEDH